MVTRPIEEIQGIISNYLKDKHNVETELLFSKTPSAEKGDISFPLFNVAKKMNISPNNLYDLLISELTLPEFIEKTEFEKGFLNIGFKKDIFTLYTLESILNKEKYGQNNILDKERIIVEHTSSNPTGPLHIGNFRGSVLGDVLARLFDYLGASVNIRYYVNDLGRQIAPLIIGYYLFEEENISSDGKIDLWLGKIYASMNTFLEIHQLMKKLTQLGFTSENQSKNYWLDEISVNQIATFLDNLPDNNEEKIKTSKWVEKLVRIQNSLSERISDIYLKLHELVASKVPDLDGMTSDYVVSYQMGEDKEIVNKFRKVTNKALQGHIETLELFQIHHDEFDWESDVAWSGEVDEMLSELESKDFLRHDGKARLLKNNFIAEKLEYKTKYSINYEIPETIIVNFDGITLYPCRDIVYHIHKLEKFNATLCYNVIAKMQQLPQLAVRLALYGLNNQEKADKIFHFDYEYVSLIGRKMAGREFDYVTPDELFDLAQNEVKSIIESRDYTEEEGKLIAKKVSASSIKYHILKMDPQKSVAFDVKKAVDPNENSGSFLQYSYARALNILNKAKNEGVNVESIINSMKEIDIQIEKQEEWVLIKLMEELPSQYIKAMKSLRPDSIANYSYSLAAAFHKFYDACHVLKAENTELMQTRIALVVCVIRCLDSLFEVMGIETLEKM